MDIAEYAGNAFVKEQHANGSRPACPAQSKTCQQASQQESMPGLSPAQVCPAKHASLPASWCILQTVHCLSQVLTKK